MRDLQIKGKMRNMVRHKWQILTYAWLRRQQADAKPIVAGIIFYLNELVPSKEDLIVVQQDIHNNLTDIPKEGDLKKMLH